MDKNVVIDNGQYSLKFANISQDSPMVVPNCVIRTLDKRVHLGSAIATENSMKDLSLSSGGLSNIQFQRPINNGQCFQWNLETQIWDNAFVNSGVDSGNGDFLTDAQLCYIESPMSLPKFQNMTDQILFEEFGIGSLVRTSGPALAPWLTPKSEEGAEEEEPLGKPTSKSSDAAPYRNFQLVIDSGFDATWVVPVIYGIPHYDAIRKLPIAGKFLNGYLREIVSFRHYNIVDEPILVNAIKHKTSYIAQDFNETLDKLTRLKKTPTQLIRSPYALTYVLPNHKTDFVGHVIDNISNLSKPELLKLERSLQKRTVEDLEEDLSDSESNDLVQSVLLTDERFMIPELLFRPQLSGVLKAGLIQTIKSSLDAVPELIRPLLVHNMVCMGGTANIPGFEARVAKDLDPEVPVEATTKVLDYTNVTDDKSLLAWHAGKAFFEKGGFDKVKMTKEEYTEFGAEYAQEKFGHKVKKKRIRVQNV